MTSTLQLDDNSISISQETWNDLVTGPNSVAYSNVRSLAVDTVKRGGKFFIYRDNEDTSVLISCDRLSEVTQLVEQADKQRADLGL